MRTETPPRIPQSFEFHEVKFLRDGDAKSASAGHLSRCKGCNSTKSRRLFEFCFKILAGQAGKDRPAPAEITIVI